MSEDAKRSSLIDAPIDNVLVCRAERGYRLASRDKASCELGASTDATPIIAVDLEGGLYRQYAADDRQETLAAGRLSIVNTGSYQQPIDFVGLDPAIGLLLRVDLHELDFPFLAVGGDGLVLTGHSEWERRASP